MGRRWYIGAVAVLLQLGLGFYTGGPAGAIQQGLGEVRQVVGLLEDLVHSRAALPSDSPTTTTSVAPASESSTSPEPLCPPITRRRPTPGCDYIVVRNDSFTSIARGLPGGAAGCVAWRDTLIEANSSRLHNPKDPSKLYSGQVLQIPRYPSNGRSASEGC